MSVRVRFAPSPTGLLHIGALRTAVYDYLFARKHGGANILRLEDTDRSRYDPNSEAEFIESLAWAGVEFDEGPHVGGPHGPYRQSERKEAGLYTPWIQELLDSGAAYKAFDTPEELKEMREHQEKNKLDTGYFGGVWREATPDQLAEAEGKPYVIRLRIPRGRTLSMVDAVRGKIEWNSDTVDDPVLIKTDGMPTYHFAAIVDDHLMEITHALRGEEWLPSAPKHAALYEAFGWEMPIYVHCPVIVGKDGRKLSKRHGATRVLDYAAQGYLAGPLKNFIALIGWAPGGDREIMSEDELIEAFDLEGLQVSSGQFDLDKLKWMNGAGIRAMTCEGVLEAALALIADPATKRFHCEEVAKDEGSEEERAALAARWESFQLLADADRDYALECVKLAHERITTLVDLGEACEFLLVDQPKMDEKAVEKWLTQEHVPGLFLHLIAELDSDVTIERCEKVIREYAEAKGFDKLGPVVHPTRVALTGKTTGPGLFELMAVLGPDRIRRRLGKHLPEQV